MSSKKQPMLMKKKQTLRFSFILFFLVSNLLGYSQGNTPCTATTLPIGTSCTYQSGTTVGATFSNDNFPAPSCGSSGSPDVWYTFTATTSGTYTLATSSGSITDGVMQLISATACNGSGTETVITCNDDFSGFMPGISASLTAGTVYYVRFWNYGSSGTGTFNICLTGPPTPPANDNCSSATNLPCGTSNLSGTTANSVSETHGTGCTMSAYGVWYTFVGNGQNTTITVSGGTLDAEMAIVTGSCGSFSNITCQDLAGSGGTETFTFTTVNGTNYYVYVGYYGTGTTTGTFNISRSCAAAPTPPTNDACSAATNLPCGTSNLAGTTVNSALEVPGTGCTMSQYGVWYTFVGNGQNTTVTVSGGTLDAEMAIVTGSCGSFSNITCQDAAGSGGTETFTFTTVNGTNYYVYVGYYGTGTTTGTFNISRTCVAAPTPPTNDACSAATNLPCGTSNMAGTTVNAALETTPGCVGFVNGYGVWYSFAGNGQNVNISVTASGFDPGLAIFSGTCASLSQLYCVDNTGTGGTETQSFSTVNGTTYFVYVGNYSGSTGGTFTISSTCTANPCSTASALPCGTSNLAGTTVGQTSQSIPGCTGYVSNYGVWYTFTGNGDYSSITVNTTTFDAGVALFSGSCGSLTQLACVDNSGSSGSENIGVATTNGTTYYVYVAYYDDWYTTTGNFTITHTCMVQGSCPTSPTNDYCAYAAQLTEGPGNFSSNTSSNYTADQTQIDNWVGNSTFCGSLENNSWYIFTANSTTETFPITYVGGCDFGYGIQGHVYQVGYNAQGCCSTFSPVSNCYNPGSATTGTITATGLGIGNSYVLMIDGNAGDDCDFTISGWSATGILPVEMTRFTGSVETFGDLLEWTTDSEINNDYFEIRHSRDGINYTTIGYVDGVGNSNTRQEYSFINSTVLDGLNYYQIQQVDINGFKKASEVITLTRIKENNIVISIYPNPTETNSFFEYNAATSSELNFRLLDYTGKEVFRKTNYVEKGSGIFPIELEKLSDGIYLLEITFAKEVRSYKIVKN